MYRNSRFLRLWGAPYERKNWLFVGNNRGGDAYAVAMSLIATAKAHSHVPLAYLTGLLTRLPGSSRRDLDSPLPMNSKPAEP
jgi:hypothetical protein